MCGDRVFLAGVDESKDALQATCFDRRSGKLLWQHNVAEGIQKDGRSNYASPSPVADGKLVVFFYGNGDMVCFNLDGSTRWRRNIQKDYGTFAFQWTFSSSPTLYGGKLYLPVLHAQRGRPRLWYEGPRESVVFAGHRSAKRQDAMASNSLKSGRGRIARILRHRHSF